MGKVDIIRVYRNIKNIMNYFENTNGKYNFQNDGSSAYCVDEKGKKIFKISGLELPTPFEENIFITLEYLDNKYNISPIFILDDGYSFINMANSIDDLVNKCSKINMGLNWWPGLLDRICIPNIIWLGNSKNLVDIESEAQEEILDYMEFLAVKVKQFSKGVYMNWCKCGVLNYDIYDYLLSLNNMISNYIFGKIIRKETINVVDLKKAIDDFDKEYIYSNNLDYSECINFNLDLDNNSEYQYYDNIIDIYLKDSAGIINIKEESKKIIKKYLDIEKREVIDDIEYANTEGISINYDVKIPIYSIESLYQDKDNFIERSIRKEEKGEAYKLRI